MTRAKRQPYPTPAPTHNHTELMHLAGTETATGAKTFTGAMSVRGSISEAATGVDRVDIGVGYGAPRVLLEDSATSTIWGFDNAGGVFRLFTYVAGVGAVWVTSDAAGNLDVAGQVGANAAAPVLAKHLTRKDYVDAQNTPSTLTKTRAVAQTIATDNVEVVVDFDTTVETVNMTYDSANNEAVIGSAGLYLVQADCLWSNGSLLGVRMLHIVKNPRGVPTARVTLKHDHMQPGGPDSYDGFGVVEDISNHCCRVVRLAAGDRMGCTVLKRTNAGAPVSLNIVAGSAVLTLTRLGP